MNHHPKTCKIAIIICYFGQWPWYFDFFIHSCQYNPTIDFFIITDIPYSKNVPSNVNFISMSMEEVRQLASQKLGFTVCLDFSYKLCDYKPAYGVIFSHLLINYDFWGQSDIDIIYGDVRNFMNDEVLHNHDFISVRHDYTTGSFALYRNSEFMNNLFKRSKDYLLIFTSPEHFCFDECNFMQEQLEEGASIFSLDTAIESFTHLIKSAELNKEIKAYFEFMLIEGAPGNLKFVNGKVYYKNEYEAILYHLILFKRIYSPAFIRKKIPGVYRISPKRIYFNK